MFIKVCLFPGHLICSKSKDMKQFWLGENPIGQGMLCPRDLRAGCAMVDWIPRVHCHKQTHFMSWTWKYSLSQLQSALRTYEGAHATTFFFMCFFCNNQFRILIEGSIGATSDLEVVFKKNLSRIGQMVAILDTFQNPIYLKRVWTIYEQFIAYSSDIPVTFLMPEASSASLLLEVSKGSVGISFITQAVSQVDSARAEAWKPEDERMVKDAIRRTVGFLDNIGEPVSCPMCSGKFMQIHPFKSNLRSFKFSCRGRFRANSLVKPRAHMELFFPCFFFRAFYSSTFCSILQDLRKSTSM